MSDPLVPESANYGANGGSAGSSGLSVLPNQWAVHRNAAGRFWYEHRTTGFRTHVRPLTAVVSTSSLPTGWKVHVNSDGRKYYANVETGVKLFTPPVLPVLPSGWKEVRTPDGTPFFVCEALQLACWERPGEQPKASREQLITITGLHNSANGSRKNTGSIPSTNAQTKPGTAQGAKPVMVQEAKPVIVQGAELATIQEVKPGRTKMRRPSKSTVVQGVAAAGAAVDVALNIAQLASAASLTPSGVFTATKAAARLTTQGVKFAGKKIKMRKSTFRRAGKLINTVSVLTGDDNGDCNGDGDDFDDGGSDCDGDSNGDGDNNDDVDFNGDGDFNTDGDSIANGDPTTLDNGQQGYENNGSFASSAPVGYDNQYQYNPQPQPQVVNDPGSIYSPTWPVTDVAPPAAPPMDEPLINYQPIDQTAVFVENVNITQDIVVENGQSFYTSTSLQVEAEVDLISLNDVSNDSLIYGGWQPSGMPPAGI
jgi:hypothetical protein